MYSDETPILTVILSVGIVVFLMSLMNSSETLK